MPSRLRLVSHDLAVAVIGGLVVAVLATGTAVAVTTTAVSITNPTTGKRAHVTNQSSLVTSERDAVSGTYAKVDATGRQYVSDLPGNPWNTGGLTLGSSDGYGVLVRLEDAQKLAVTSLTATGMSGTGVIRFDLVVFVGSAKTANCENLGGATFTRYEEYAFALSLADTQHVTFPTPLVLSRGSASGKVTCVSISVTHGPSGGGTYGAEFAAAGFKL
jgi:hypothetical protein